MNAALEFPSNCTTNVYTLNDFGEIAYIVCTVAVPPTHDPAAFITTTENTLARLRKTERQFRENSILAALDVEERQLFTFYKKVDITAQKDQKTLLLKFGYVLRSNTCTIAYKTAARLPDLMKPEQSRLYRLFITAIVSSIKLLPSGDAALQPIGPNLYLIEAKPSISERDAFVKHRKWMLYRIDLQVVSSGHIILTIVKDDGLLFSCLEDSKSNLCSVDNEFMAVYLAPIGGIGRVSSSKYQTQEQVNDVSGEKHWRDDAASDARAKVWKELLPPWLKEHMNFALNTTDITWIEVEVPLEEGNHTSEGSEIDVLDSHSALNEISWRTIFWPRNLCYSLNGHNSRGPSILESDQDPVQFVRDWISGTGLAAIKTDTERQKVMEEDDEALFADEGTFDDTGQYQSFGPPVFSASQNIYPTPSDIGIAHPTPGLSSVDGIAVTPANFPGSSAEMSHQQDEDMPDFEEVPTASGMSGYYNEDLFEEMPDDTFTQEANVDEPNWDFFDSPGDERKHSRSGSHSHKEGSLSRDDPKQEQLERKDLNTLKEQFLPQPIPVKHEMSTIESAATLLPVAAQSQISSDLAPLPNENLSIEQKKPLQSPSKPVPPLWQSNQVADTVSTVDSRRRLSIFEGSGLVSPTPRRDSRYDADGDYWFDPSPVLPKVKMHVKPYAVYQRPPSSPSESDSSMAGSSPSAEQNAVGQDALQLFRQWIQYDPDLQDGSAQQKEVDKTTIQQDVQQILSLLEPGLVNPPIPQDFELEKRIAPGTPPEVVQKMLHVAQVLVDQVTQTSLINQDDDRGRPEVPGKDYVEMSVDLAGVNTSAISSNLWQLINLKADSNGGRLQGSVSRHRPNQICVRRMERPLIASLSILDFWDTLNLQPEHGPKDITALCIHPNPENVMEGSLNLLQRLSDSYNTCALGAHVTGRLAGLTDDGMISYHLDSPGERTLLQTATLVGKALAITSHIEGTVVVYMISRGQDSTSYLEMCMAFYDLFEAFTKARRDSQGVSDIQLQIIPQNFVASPDTLVVPPQTAYIKLAIEVYNRLPPIDLTGPPAACGSAVVLSRSENSVNLRLTPTYGSPLEKDGPCLHLAYAVSWDKRWLTAIWTDELGQIALSMSYCSHSRPQGIRRPRDEIFNEMWEVSHDLMCKVRGPWRLAVIRQGYYEAAELLEWQQIFDSSPTSQKRCLLLLLSVQLRPGLLLLPPMTPGKQTGTQNYYGTPASTPQASMTSPDQMVPATPTPGGSTIMNASTPPDFGFDPNNESDLTVVDLSEESWGIVLPFGTNQSRNMTELHPSQITGHLLTRRGPKSEDGYNVIEISLVKSITVASNKSNSFPPDESLEDLIRQYRGLVTLGAARGCVDPNRECLPWHIATAMRGVRVLEQVM